MTTPGPVNGKGVAAQRPTDEDSTMTTASRPPEQAISGSDLGEMLRSARSLRARAISQTPAAASAGVLENLGARLQASVIRSLAALLGETDEPTLSGADDSQIRTPDTALWDLTRHATALCATAGCQVELIAATAALQELACQLGAAEGGDRAAKLRALMQQLAPSGADMEAKQIVSGLVHAVGFEPVDLGGWKTALPMDAPGRNGAVYGEAYTPSDARKIADLAARDIAAAYALGNKTDVRLEVTSSAHTDGCDGFKLRNCYISEAWSTDENERRMVCINIPPTQTNSRDETKSRFRFCNNPRG